MNFASIYFSFIFFPIVIFFYLILNFACKKNRILNIFLCFVSIFFYWIGGGLESLKFIFLVIFINYIFLYILSVRLEKFFFFCGIIFNVLLLIKFKYPYLIQNLFLSVPNNKTTSFIPIASSFIIFNSISMLVDYYQISKENNLKGINEYPSILNIATYLLFFPKIMQGPIIKYKQMCDQIESRTFSYKKFLLGIERFILGFSKKTLLADIFATVIFEMKAASALDVQSYWLLILLYGLQLYFDFSGYSDMAIGISNILGFDFSENFNFPYKSTSISEFWRRWHISLGSWFREYIYIPLGGNRKGSVYINLIIVFLLTGIWHGNTLIFLCWGLTHGLLMCFEKTKIYLRISKIPFFSFIGWTFTTGVVFIGWSCFWCSSVTDFFDLLKKLLGLGINTNEIDFTWRYYFTPMIFVLVLFSWIGIFIFDNLKVKKLFSILKNKVVFLIIKYAMLITLLILCFINIVANGYQPFLYFQF